MPKKLKVKSEIRPRFRITSGGDIALGPGKIELLHALQRSKSIREAARCLGMSYMRAWTLVRTMNHCFKEYLVEATRGPVKGGGGAHLTPTGKRVLAIYQQINTKSLSAIQPEWRRLQKLLRAEGLHPHG